MKLANILVMKLNLILDIDETLINFVSLSLWDTISNADKAKYKYIVGNDGVIVARPYVKELLDYAFSTCDVSIWTWACEKHAHDVLHFIAKNRLSKIRNIWSANDANTAYRVYGKGKDLRHLWFSLNINGFMPCNTVLVDDLDDNVSHEANRRNSIQVPAFKLFGISGAYLDPSSDVALLNVIELLKEVNDRVPFCKKGLMSPFTTLKTVPSVQQKNPRRLKL